MTEKELRKQYDQEWKNQQPEKYLLWLVMYAGSAVPILAALGICLTGLTDTKLVWAGVLFFLFFVMEIIAVVLAMEHKRGWPAYREANKHLLK